MKTLLTVLAFSLAAVAQPPSAHDLAQRVDRYYNALTTFQAEFVESYRGAGLARTESGTLWLKQPGRMRWDYRVPTPKLFLTDGKNAWFYVPGEQQARRTPLKKLDDLRSPLRYLLGHTRLEKELAGLSLAADLQPATPGNVVLRGVPRGLEDRVSEVLLEVNPALGRIERLTLHELDGATTEFTFRSAQLNAPIADDKFRFTVPAGVQVIEAGDLAPQ